MRALPLAILALGASFALSAAVAEPSATNRYELQPTDGGFLRLDRETGATSFCKASGDGYACRPTSEDAKPAAGEIAALEKRIVALEEKVDGAAKALPPVPPLPQDDPKAKDGAKTKDDTLKLPSDEQLDRIVGFLERAMKRLKDLAREAQEDSGAGDKQRL